MASGPPSSLKAKSFPADSMLVLARPGTTVLHASPKGKLLSSLPHNCQPYPKGFMQILSVKNVLTICFAFPPQTHSFAQSTSEMLSGVSQTNGNCLSKLSKTFSQRSVGIWPQRKGNAEGAVCRSRAQAAEQPRGGDAFAHTERIKGKTWEEASLPPADIKFPPVNLSVTSVPSHQQLLHRVNVTSLSSLTFINK